jgi:hypothetical protein
MRNSAQVEHSDVRSYSKGLFMPERDTAGAKALMAPIVAQTSQPLPDEFPASWKGCKRTHERPTLAPSRVSGENSLDASAAEVALQIP